MTDDIIFVSFIHIPQFSMLSLLPLFMLIKYYIYQEITIVKAYFMYCFYSIVLILKHHILSPKCTLKFLKKKHWI